MKKFISFHQWHIDFYRPCLCIFDIKLAAHVNNLWVAELFYRHERWSKFSQWESRYSDHSKITFCSIRWIDCGKCIATECMLTFWLELQESTKCSIEDLLTKHLLIKSALLDCFLLRPNVSWRLTEGKNTIQWWRLSKTKIVLLQTWTYFFPKFKHVEKIGSVRGGKMLLLVYLQSKMLGVTESIVSDTKECQQFLRHSFFRFVMCNWMRVKTILCSVMPCDYKSLWSCHFSERGRVSFNGF